MEKWGRQQISLIYNLLHMDFKDFVLRVKSECQLIFVNRNRIDFNWSQISILLRIGGSHL